MREQKNKKKTVSVRRQKVRKNHVREKLIFFAILALILLIVAAFARKLCPYDPDIQDLLQAQKPPSAEHILGTDRYGRDMFSRVLVGSTISIYATLLLVAIVTVAWNSDRYHLWLVRWNCRYNPDAHIGSFSGISEPCFCTCSGRCAWWRYTKCSYSACGDRLAKVCQTCQRADACAEGGTVSDGGETVRKQYI